MTTIIDIDTSPDALSEPAEILKKAKKTVVLTGAGISVESGIPDFRSPGGLWSVFDPAEYATLETFLANPKKAWKLYREIAKSLVGSLPNPAHHALASLEKNGFVHSIITQNIDSLHQAAGSESVIEIHGEHKNLQCIHCDKLFPIEEKHLKGDAVPTCTNCGKPLKPNVVLFGEQVRNMDKIMQSLMGADLMLVVGASVLVSPANSLPAFIADNGGKIIEFNLENTPLTEGFSPNSLFGPSFGIVSDFLIKGPAGRSLPILDKLVTEK